MVSVVGYEEGSLYREIFRAPFRVLDFHRGFRRARAVTDLAP
jgi:hypothetical protein